MQDIYRTVRIPLHHGILGQYVRKRSDTTTLSLLGQLGLHPALDSRRFEEEIENHALGEIDTILTQIELLYRKGTV